MNAQLKEEIIPFAARDGKKLNLIHVLGPKPPSKGPVILVHGAGVRANIFRAPVHTSIVDALINDGFDVWLENWRASVDFTPCAWTLDDAALYDHPAAVDTVLEKTGATSMKAIIHCQGSTSFAMSAVAGLLPNVDTIVSNAVSLHPIVSSFSRFKLNYISPLVKLMTNYLNPHWGVDAPNLRAKFLLAFVKLTHHECDNNVCRFASFIYGTGFPTMWLHENLNDETHEWLKEEFKAVPMSFFKQITQCVNAGHLTSVKQFPELPNNFIRDEPKTDARFAFFAGENNLCFLPKSQKLTFQFFNQFRTNFHKFHLLQNYSHLDVFMGKNAATDVFPKILAELNTPNNCFH